MISFKNGTTAEAVIFDFDGVIVDTEPLHYAAFDRTLAPLDLNFTWEEYVETYIGFDDRDAFRHAHAARGIPLSDSTLRSLIEQKAHQFHDIIRSGVCAYPGVVELITRLHDSNVPLAICSGALRSDIDPILTMLGIEGRFDVIVTADDVSVSKPDPECYRLAFERLHTCRGGFTLAGTVAIEDTPAGITSARGAGLQVCAVTNSYPAARLDQATFVTDSLTSLL